MHTFWKLRILGAILPLLPPFSRRGADTQWHFTPSAARKETQSWHKRVSKTRYSVPALSKEVIIRPKRQARFREILYFLCFIHDIHYFILFYGSETWSLTLRENHRLTALENTVLRRIFGSKRNEVTGVWRRLHNEQLNLLASEFGI
jgi:hypothetical protein